MSRRPAALTLLALFGAGCDSSTEPPDPAADGGIPDPPDRHPGDFVFAEDVLHEIRIEVSPDDLDALENDREARVPCTFTFDGITLDNVGIRQKGQGTNSGSLYTKPSLSVKFDEYDRSQDLDGLEKLIFDNGAADPTLMNEPLGFAAYRRAGIPGPRTGHAVITLVGLPQGELTYGVHVMVEAVDPVFLRQAFGAANGDGNLYEDEARGDFGTGPELVDLKDEEQGRTREHLFRVAQILQDTPADQLVAELSPHFDIDRAIASFATDMLVVHWDGFWTASHNYYLYDNPGDGRFVLLPHGMDLLFGGYCPAEDQASSLLGQRILEVPELHAQLEETKSHLLDTMWDPEIMLGQIDQVTALLDASPHTEPAFLNDLRAFHENIERLALSIVSIDQAVDGPAVCGNGQLEREEMCTGQCDDGNQQSSDGCSAQCRPETCGDGIVQPGLGEVCDDWTSCNATCTGPIQCGDHAVDGSEGCDDGNHVSNDGCSDVCQLEWCGDGVLQPGLGEACDGERLCRPDCSGMIECGDADIEWPEYCDDGNQLDGDGCTNECEARCVSETHGAWTFDFCLAETNFELAGPICAHVGGAPATPRTEEENDWLLETAQLHAPGPWWLGIQEDDQGTWRDLTGSALRVDGWAVGEPSGSGACAVLDPAASGWSADACEAAHPVVCRR